MCIRDRPRVAPELSMKTYWYYKNAHLIDQSWSVRACGVRQRHIDQAQKMCIRDSHNMKPCQWVQIIFGLYAIANQRNKVPGIDAHEILLLHRRGPVSYTHLDVYKRQGWGQALFAALQAKACRTPTCDKAAARLRCGEPPAAVSYTHLKPGIPGNVRICVEQNGGKPGGRGLSALGGRQ